MSIDPWSGSVGHAEVRPEPGDRASYMAKRSSGNEQRFRDVFEEQSRSVLGYALRRVDVPADAADIVAETFLVAWRRLDDMPDGVEARLWLFGVARRVLANHRRGVLRRRRLGEKLRSELEGHVSADPSDHIDAVHVVREAMGSLDSDDAELLRLTSWEGLTPTELAVVFAIPAATARSRLYRARQRLRAELEASGWEDERNEGSGHVSDDGHPLVQDAEEKP